MKAITTLSLLTLSPAAMAHTGDHSATVSALAHAFGSVEHLAAALAVMACVTAVIAVAGKVKTKLVLRRAK
mgnify:FL=1